MVVRMRRTRTVRASLRVRTPAARPENSPTAYSLKRGGEGVAHSLGAGVGDGTGQPLFTVLFLALNHDSIVKPNNKGGDFFPLEKKSPPMPVKN